jgi:LacI family transcriptional regulator
VVDHHHYFVLNLKHVLDVLNGRVFLYLDQGFLHFRQIGELVHFFLDFEKAGFLCGELLAKQLRDPKAKGETRTFGILGVVKRQSTTIFKHTNAKVAAAVEYIRRHAADGILVDDVVRQMGCSRRTAEMSFSKLTGHTIQSEIRNVRMAMAFAMLRNPRRNIAGIAHLCGYDSDSTLRYAFKAKTGMSMREWRKKELGGILNQESGR